MISKMELKEVGRILGIANVGFVEKNYFHHVILLAISREEPNLVLKGGTCLFLVYGLDRFSEDLEFSLKGPVSVEKLRMKIKSYCSRFGAKCEIKKTKSGKETILLDVSIKGPLYTGDPMTLCNVKIDKQKLVEYTLSIVICHLTP
mgnify:CR=1 FL=1